MFLPPHFKEWHVLLKAVLVPVVLQGHICCQTSWLLANSIGKCQALVCPPTLKAAWNYFPVNITCPHIEFCLDNLQ